jgi:hypothetical protein
VDEATRSQERPHGTGREITPLAQADILDQPILVPEHGFTTVYLWIRSAAAYLKSRQLEKIATVEGEVAPVVGGPIWPFLIAQELHKDLEARAALGAAKYGERLRAFNGRDPLVDAYQEMLDAWQYLRQELEEHHAD